MIIFNIYLAKNPCDHGTGISLGENLKRLKPAIEKKYTVLTAIIPH